MKIKVEILKPCLWFGRGEFDGVVEFGMDEFSVGAKLL
jgi:hypothetical protein